MRVGILSVSGLIAVLLLAGCSDNKKDSATSSSTAVSSPTTTKPVTPSFTGQGSSEFCGLISSFTTGQAKVNPTSSPAELEASFEESLTAIKQAASVAPDEIKADVVAVANSVQEVETAMAQAGFDINKIQPSALATLQSDSFLASVTRLGSYLTTVCKTGTG